MATTPSPKPVSTTKSEPAEPDANADIKEYVVLAHAITYRTGKAKNAAQRFVRGARLRLHSDEERVQDLIKSKSIGLRGERHVASTPASVFKAMGAADDPAHPPVQDVQPFAAKGGKATVPAGTAPDEPDEA